MLREYRSRIKLSQAFDLVAYAVLLWGCSFFGFLSKGQAWISLSIDQYALQFPLISGKLLKNL